MRILVITDWDMNEHVIQRPPKNLPAEITPDHID